MSTQKYVVLRKQKDAKASREAKALKFIEKNKGDFHNVQTETSVKKDQAGP